MIRQSPISVNARVPLQRTTVDALAACSTCRRSNFKKGLLRLQNLPQKTPSQRRLVVLAGQLGDLAAISSYRFTLANAKFIHPNCANLEL